MNNNEVELLKKEIEFLKKENESLREINESIQKLNRLFPVVTCELTPTTRVVDISDGGLELFGYDQVHLEKGLYGMDLFNDTDRAVIEQKMIQLKQGERVDPGEYQIRRKDGTWANVLVSSHAVFEDEIFCGFRVVLLDLSDVHFSREKSVESHNSFREFADMIPQTVYETDPDGYFVFANQLGFETFGYTFEEINHKLHVLDMIAPEDQDKASKNLKKSEMGSKRTEHDYIGIKKDGTRFPITVYSSAVISGNEITGYRGIVIDMSYHEEIRRNIDKTESQLFDVQKMEVVARVAKGVAHDFYNILTVIISGTELIQERTAQDTRLFEELDDIKQSAHRGSSLIGKLLAFSTKQIISPRSLNLNETLVKNQQLLESICGEGISINLYTDDGILDIFIDELQLEQLLTNIIINSKEAITGSGEINIRTGMEILGESDIPIHIPSDKKEFVVLEITDNGSGIDPGIMNSIFEPFFTTKENSSGLGLATVYGIARQNNGFIRISSTPGEGTTVAIYLQTAKKASKPLPSTRELMLINSSSFKIFVVEDEGMVLGAVTRILKRKGFSVMGFQDPEEALGVFEEIGEEIDLLLTDVIMPRLDGKKLSEEMLRINPSLKVIFMSGHNELIVSEKGILKEGMNFIQKPFTMNQLVHRVKSALFKKDESAN
ncbi:MAG: PAS domain S-box protein [Deltaproteobacteria bacterium]|nr:PAS domain S-box protein [Deltaproteobacteria bacterium]